MARKIGPTVEVVHPDHGTATIPAHKLDVLKAAGWKKATKSKKKETEDDAES